ncbi:MAG: type III-B CRISPR module RAMP protein Cmr4 [Verrucomicrobiae bacterium]|nr:type III-B CRISPR module RAMP protein Cmr4 [Verrucomicrobiae bacterium]
MTKHLLTIYTRTPLHVGSGTSVEVVDLPIMRERITNFPVIPSTSLKGVLRQHCIDTQGPDIACRLFGNETGEKDKTKQHAGCVIVTDARLLAFPVRSLAGCFAWLTCPLALQRFQRDSGKQFAIPLVDGEQAIAGNLVRAGNQVVLEEYALARQNGDLTQIVSQLQNLTDEPLWQNELDKRLVLVSDELFQHFVTTTTEVTARICIDPQSRTNTNLFNQENVPTEAVFYAVIFCQRERSKNGDVWNADQVIEKVSELFQTPTLLQIGGDETTGFGLCSVKFHATNETAKETVK